MTDKPHIKQERKKDTRKDGEPSVQAEVIEDLDVPTKDEDSLRGGATSTRPACVGY